ARGPRRARRRGVRGRRRGAAEPRRDVVAELTMTTPFELPPTRRAFLQHTGSTLMAAALAHLRATEPGAAEAGTANGCHHAPPARAVIYLFLSGGASQIDLFDPKPGLVARKDQELPPSVRMGQRITSMTSGQTRLPIAPSPFAFAPHGDSGIEFSELLPFT